jgi:hypothetical protein
MDLSQRRFWENIEMVRGFAPYPVHKMFSDKDLRPFGWLLDSLYKCRESSTNRRCFFQNKANSPEAQNEDKLSFENGL